MKKLFRSPWIRIWLLLSFFWTSGFHLWAYMSWEKIREPIVFLYEQKIKDIDDELDTPGDNDSKRGDELRDLRYDLEYYGGGQSYWRYNPSWLEHKAL